MSTWKHLRMQAVNFLSLRHGFQGEGKKEDEQSTAIILFLSSKVTPGGIQVPSRRPSPDHAGLRARRKADATGTTWVVDKERSWQP